MATASGSDDAHLYLGIGQTRGHIMVCPSLQEWIGEGLRKESLVLKERCKARALQSQGGAAGKTGSPWQEALVSYEPGPSQCALLGLGLWHWDRCLSHGFIFAPGGPHPAGGQDSFDSGKLLSMGPPRRARELLPLHLPICSFGEAGKVCHAVSRRRRRLAHAMFWAIRGVNAINELGGHSIPGHRHFVVRCAAGCPFEPLQGLS